MNALIEPVPTNIHSFSKPASTNKTNRSYNMPIKLSYIRKTLYENFIGSTICTQPLKTLDTIGNCHRPVFSLGVYQHMHKITNL